MSRLAIEAGLVLIAASASFAYAVHDTTERLNTAHNAELTRISSEAAQAVVDALETARAAEQQGADKMAALDAVKFKELQSEIISKDRSIADLRAGTIRVRDEFTCTGGAASGTSKAGTSTGLGDAASAGGLQSQHVEFLLREAGRADEAVKQLQACQDIVAGDRADASGASKP